jgi:hypothetical protein
MALHRVLRAVATQEFSFFSARWLHLKEQQTLLNYRIRLCANLSGDKTALDKFEEYENTEVVDIRYGGGG